MSRESRVSVILLAIGFAALIGRAAFTTPGMGKEYIRTVQPTAGAAPEVTRASYGEYRRAVAANPAQTEYRFSWTRTIGLWAAAFFTLAIFSFLYRDNPFYKLAEAIFVGVAAAYYSVVAFWSVLVPNVLGKVLPSVAKGWAMPGLSGPEAQPNYLYIIPLILGIMLLCRLLPRGGWIARWPMAFIIGAFAGLQMLGFLSGDFLAQIRNTIVPLVVTNQAAVDPWHSIQNILIVGGVLCCIAYFFLSFEHRGVMGGSARVGVWFLMITFGASFAYTVMGRIALLAIRIEFLLDDWLWLIDPLSRR
jgi:hypothetical protein